jgi:hypothetical protein
MEAGGFVIGKGAEPHGDRFTDAESVTDDDCITRAKTFTQCQSNSGSKDHHTIGEAVSGCETTRGESCEHTKAAASIAANQPALTNADYE